MIIYFADRKMRVLGNASTGLTRGFTASADSGDYFDNLFVFPVI